MLKTAKRDQSSIFRSHVSHTRVEFSQFGEFRAAESWEPAINMYQVPNALIVCVDLAGVDHRQIDVEILPGRLKISGARLAPAPNIAAGKGMRILSMEIDHGRFSRVIPIPDTVNLERSESEYRDGLLWIDLPLK